MIDSDLSAKQIILTVSELNRLANQVLTQSFPLFWVSGEVSNFTRAASGHWYFSLKDAGAQVRCVMFKGRNSYVDFTPREGDKIEARATVTLYEARGDFQLTVEFIQKAGLGALFEAYEKLKNKLQNEGLFDANRKKSLPAFPKKIGIVTSADAAALHDVLTTLNRRMPSIPIIIYPTPVQGKGAAELIAKAINTASKRAECDVLMICRGGGSLEDLFSFNEEIVARAIADCKIPTISGVGHETDFTICDFVADVRAATPTAAAELATPSQEVLQKQLSSIENQLNKNIQLQLQQRAQACDYLARRLISPLQQIKRQQALLSELAYRFQTQMQNQLIIKKQHLISLQQNLSHLNPLGVLTRGYAIVENSNGQVVQSVKNLEPNDTLNIRMADGKVESIVKSTDQLVGVQSHLFNH
jgi:exodeoxyribonuclease VII large subunit